MSFDRLRINPRFVVPYGRFVIMQKGSTFNKVPLNIIYQGLLFLVRYIKDLPLTFLLVHIFTVVLMTSMDLSLQKFFVMFVTFTLRINQPNFSLSARDIVAVFMIWAIPATILVEVFRKVTKIKIRLSFVFYSAALFFLALDSYLAFRLETAFVPFIWFIISLSSIFFYYLVSLLEKGLVRGWKLME